MCFRIYLRYIGFWVLYELFFAIQIGTDRTDAAVHKLHTAAKAPLPCLAVGRADFGRRESLRGAQMPLLPLELPALDRFASAHTEPGCTGTDSTDASISNLLTYRADPPRWAA